MHNMKNLKKESGIAQILDVFFIMILCFVTLLSTMLLQGKVLVGSGSSLGVIVYSFNMITFSFIGLTILIYIALVCFFSDRELKKMISFLYKTK
jgi:hypothetical protein